MDAQPTAGRSFGGYRKRLYSAGSFLRDAGGLIPELVDLSRIWAGRRIDPAFREEIMVAVARVNHCRYCVFTHQEWALHAGLPEEELERLESGSIQSFDPAKRAALEYARALGTGENDPQALAHLREHYSPSEIADIERVVRAMVLANLSGNTVDGLLSRFRGKPAEGSRLLDELFISAIWMAVAPWVALILAVWRRQSPPALLRDFRDFSNKLDSQAQGAAK